MEGALIPGAPPTKANKKEEEDAAANDMSTRLQVYKNGETNENRQVFEVCFCLRH